MDSLNGICFEENYKKILKLILEKGKKRNVRGFETIELSPFAYETSFPLRNVITSKIRNINKAFAVAEFLWIISGRDDLESISFYNSNIRKFSDDGVILKGAYGPKIVSQLDYIVSCLNNDKGSRQAVINIWEKNPAVSKDIPCTLTLHFLLNNNNELSLITNMRSNDAWLGLPYDFFTFTMIQNYVACLLSSKIGKYVHFVSTEHLYQQDIIKAQELSQSPTFVGDIHETSAMTKDELKTVLYLEKSIRNGQLLKNIDIENMSQPWRWMVETLNNFAENKHKKTLYK